MSKLANSSVLDKFERKISGQGCKRAEKAYTLFSLNEYIYDVIKIIKSMMAPMADLLITSVDSSLIQPLAYSLINATSGKVVMRAGERQEDGFLALLSLPLLVKALKKGFRRAGRGYNIMDQMDINSSDKLICKFSCKF